MQTPEHAIVSGASMAGLLAAAGLARHAKRVTVVDRDPLPDPITHRKGVPQDNQAHILLDRGRQAMSRLLPELFPELEANGAVQVDFGREFHWFHHGHWKVSCDTPYTLSSQTRPFLETHIRRQLARLANVQLRPRTEVREPILEQDRICGVELHDRERDATETLACDLFVDASGRGSRSPRWLSTFGYAEPDEVTTRINLGYASRVFRRPADTLNQPLCRLIYGERPRFRRHGVLFSVEDDRWILSLAGYGDDQPPGDLEGFEAFARGLARDDYYRLIRSAEPLSEIHVHKFPRQRWLRYDKLSRLPQGYAVLGDAVCSFDPVFGQGMSVAAIEAELLAEQFERARGFDSLGFAKACARVIKTPWTMTSVEAFRYPESEGDRPPGLPIVHRFLDRLFEVSATDPVVYRAFLEVMQMHRGLEALARPGVLLRLARGPKTQADPARPVHAPSERLS